MASSKSLSANSSSVYLVRYTAPCGGGEEMSQLLALRVLGNASLWMDMPQTPGSKWRQMSKV